MRISDTIIEELLQNNPSVSDQTIETLRQQVASSKRSWQDVVLQEGVLDEKTLVQSYASLTSVPYTEIDPRDVSAKELQRIPERIARQYMTVLFKVDEDGTQNLAMEDPDDIQALDFIKKEIGANIRVHIATRTTIEAVLDIYRGDVRDEIDEVIEIQREELDEDAGPAASEADVAENSPIAQTVNLLLEYAIKSDASDIHIEPREDFVQVRYRIDGVLREVNRIPRNVMGALVSRIKILSNLKIDERRVPQDGRFKIKVSGKQYALRVSSLPISDGEKIVMRILDESNDAITLEQLGYWGYSIDVMNEVILQPDGMVLVTGPTGSGKSTSLFSALSRLNTPDVNISTIEDPVEYKIPGVNQTQTNPKAGMTFANGLRALLRQDPNIIMVGEIRDSETANLGVQAALTGHLVFSTLHTNNAATTLPRLLDMEIEPFLIASTVKAVVGQRLVRRLDAEKRVSYKPSEEEKEAILELLGLNSEDSFKRIHELEIAAKEAGIGGDNPLSTDENGINKLWRVDETLDEPGDGYKGRVGLYEVLRNSLAIQKLIMANATANEIQDKAIEEGMLTMQLDGIIKALRGETTIEEVLRVTREK